MEQGAVPKLQASINISRCASLQEGILTMLEQKLKKSFDKYFEAPIEVWKNFISLCDKVEFKKNETIKGLNQTEKYAYFILSGACGVFLWKENNFVCLDIVLENDFLPTIYH